MKKLIIFIAAVIFAGCQKDKTIQTPDSGGGGPAVTSLKVVEVNSGIPVSGAKVILDKCYQKDVNDNCVSFVMMGEKITNEDGIFAFPVNWEVARMTATKNQYWDARVFDNNNDILMIPEGWANVMVRREGRYPDDYKMVLWKNTEDPNLHDWTVSITLSDIGEEGMLIPIRCFATVPDKINWKITNNNGKEVLEEGSTPYFTINRFETMYVDLHYAIK